jgi:predicted PurR-regulated permease PerM
MLLRPFVSALLGSFILAYILHPFYRRLKSAFKNKIIAAVLVILILLLIFLLPSIFVVNSLLQEVAVNKIIFTKIVSTADLLRGDCASESIICQVRSYLAEFIDETELKFHINNAIDSVSRSVLNLGGNFVFSLPIIIMNFFVMIFIIFFLLLEGENFVEKVKNLVPLDQKHRTKIFNRMGEVTYAVMFGHVLVAMIQGLIGYIVFMIFGVQSAALWAFIMFFFALIPFIGTPVIWLPAALIKLVSEEPWSALGLFISGIFISTIDNLLKPIIISGRADVHPVIVLLGVIGGLISFGIVGIIIGPVILSIVVKIIEIYEEILSEAKSKRS